MDYIYEPDAATILDQVLPRFTEMQIYQAVLESIASEQSARMVAMRNARDSAARPDRQPDADATTKRARRRSPTKSWTLPAAPRPWHRQRAAGADDAVMQW